MKITDIRFLKGDDTPAEVENIRQTATSVEADAEVNGPAHSSSALVVEVPDTFGGPPSFEVRASDGAAELLGADGLALRFATRDEAREAYLRARGLDAERIADRNSILWDVDERACQGCGLAYTEEQIADLAEDPGWYVDSEAHPNESCTGTFVEVAIIRCPACW